MELNSNYLSTQKKLSLWDLAFSITILLFAGLSYFLSSPWIFTSVALSGFIILAIISKEEIKRIKPFGGYANWVTAFRFLNVIVFSTCYQHLDHHILGIWMLIVVLLDGVDGYLARKFKMHSDFGAKFDTETDAFYVALASLILYSFDLVSWWILIPGFLKYPYEILRNVLGQGLKPIRTLKSSKVIAVIFFFSLILPLFYDHIISHVVLGIASILIIISFIYTFVGFYSKSKK